MTVGPLTEWGGGKKRRQTRMSSVAAQSVAVMTRRAHTTCAGRKRGMCGHEQLTQRSKTAVEMRGGKEDNAERTGERKRENAEKVKKKSQVTHSLAKSE